MFDSIVGSVIDSQLRNQDPDRTVEPGMEKYYREAYNLRYRGYRDKFDPNLPIGVKNKDSDALFEIPKLNDMEYYKVKADAIELKKQEDEAKIRRAQEAEEAERNRMKNLGLVEGMLDPANLKRQVNDNLFDPAKRLLAGAGTGAGKFYEGAGNLLDVASLPMNAILGNVSFDKPIPKSFAGGYINDFAKWGTKNAEDVRSGTKDNSFNRFMDRAGHTVSDIIGLATTSKFTGGAPSGFALHSFSQAAPELLTDPLKVAGKTLEGATIGKFLHYVNQTAPGIRVPTLFGAGTGMSAAGGNNLDQAIEDGVWFGGLGFLGGKNGYTVQDIKNLYRDPIAETIKVKQQLRDAVDSNSEIAKRLDRGEPVFGETVPPEVKQARLEKQAKENPEPKANVEQKPAAPIEEMSLEDMYKKYHAEEVSRAKAPALPEESQQQSNEYLMKRGVQRQEQLEMHIDLLDRTGFPADVIKRAKVGDTYNSAELIALGRTIETLDSNFRNFNRMFLEKQRSNTVTPTDILQYADRYGKMMHEINLLKDITTAGRSEAGRTLHASKQINQTLADVTKQLEQLGGETNIPKIAEMVESFKNTADSVSFLQRVRPTDTLDKIIYYYMNSILSGPRTHITNISGNTGSALYSVGETFWNAGVGAIRSGLSRVLTGKPATDRIYFREAMARAGALMDGWGDTFRATGRAFKENKSSDGTYRPEADAARAENRFDGPVGKAVGVPGRFLVTEDEFFKSIARRMYIRQQATHEGIQAGLSGKKLKAHVEKEIDNPSKEMIEGANEHARYQTFQKELGTFGKRLEKLANDGPGRALKFVVPFIRTPANLIKYAGERSPLGLLSKKVRDEIEAGGARADVAIGKMTMGTAMIAMASYLAYNGHITGGGPADKKLNALWRAQGNRPYTFRIPGTETWVPYGRIDPFSTLIGAAADVTLYTKNDFKKKDQFERLYNTMQAAFVHNVSNKSFLSGAINFAQIFDDSQQGADSKAYRFGQQLAGAMMPYSSFFRQMNDSDLVGDPLVRDVRSVADKLMSQTPGLSGNLPIKYDILGEPVKKDYRGVYVSPFTFTKVKDNKLLETMVRLEVAPAPIDRKVAGVELPGDVYARLTKMSGTIFKNMMTDITESPDWANIPAFKKAEMIKSALYQARAFARMKIYSENPELFRKIKTEEIKNKYRMDDSFQFKF